MLFNVWRISRWMLSHSYISIMKGILCCAWTGAVFNVIHTGRGEDWCLYLRWKTYIQQIFFFQSMQMYAPICYKRSTDLAGRGCWPLSGVSMCHHVQVNKEFPFVYCGTSDPYLGQMVQHNLKNSLNNNALHWYMACIRKWQHLHIAWCKK